MNKTLAVSGIIRFVALCCVAVLASCASSQKTTEKAEEMLKGASYDPPGSTQTTDKPITRQNRRIVSFLTGTNTRISFSTEFAGARLTDVLQTNDSTYTLMIAPENAPVNASAWFAFKIWASAPQRVNLTLKYAIARHRYIPKISTDGKRWQIMDSTRYTRVSSEAILRLDLMRDTRDTIWIAGQELITSADINHWADNIATNPATAPFVRKSLIGQSSQGRQMYKLDISEAQAGTEAGYVVLLGRQHPPEVTGNMAYWAFVETLTADTELAKAFRKRFRVIAIPCVNPDGVDGGHWRHNAHGIDLNRDWQPFNQPETRLVRDEFLNIKREAEQRGTSIKFGIDFHSTSEDVFYVVPVDSSALLAPEVQSSLNKQYVASYRRIKTLFARLQSAMPHYFVNVDESPDNAITPSSNRWMSKELGAASTTYEVGDNTDRALLREVARTNARLMMEMLVNGE